MSIQLLPRKVAAATCPECLVVVPLSKYVTAFVDHYQGSKQLN